MSGPENQVGPHKWDPQTVRYGFLWLKRLTICRACYLPEEYHPTDFWSRARPIGDRAPVYSFSPGDGRTSPGVARQA